MTSGTAPERRDDGVFASATAPAQGAADHVADFAAHLRRATDALTVTTELAYRRLVDLALASEGRLVIDRPELAAETRAYGAWPGVRRKLVECGLIRLTTDGIAIRALEPEARS